MPKHRRFLTQKTHPIVPLLLCICLVGFGVSAGLIIASQWKTERNLPARLVSATASDADDSFALATGLVGNEAEGVFVLNQQTGELTCTLLYPRFGRFMAVFSTNVKQHLPDTGKGGKYLMATGTADFLDGSNLPLTSGAVVYVLNSATGNLACYGIPFSKVAERAGRIQTGELTYIPGSDQAMNIPRN